MGRKKRAAHEFQLVQRDLLGRSRAWAIAPTLLCFGATLTVLIGCEEETLPSGSVEDLEATIVESAGVNILILSHTLAEVAAGETRLALIEPDLLVGEAGDEHGVWFGAIADIASLGGGEFAVLDHMQAQVALIDSVGRLVSTVGREGDGPGEFRWPWSLTTVGEALVIRDGRRAFTIFSGGRVRAVAAAEPEGDWFAPMFRMPTMDLAGFQMGPEDVTRRLQPFDSTSFVHMLQANESAEFNFSDPTEFRDGIPTVLIRYDLDGQVIDTLAELTGPPTYVLRVETRSIIYVQPLFAGRPVWATGDGWYAIGHGDSTEVVVRENDGNVLLRIRTPRRRRPVTEDDRIAVADWHLARTFVPKNSYGMSRLRSGGQDVLRSNREATLSRIFHHYADSIPMITGLYGSGDCLYLSGFRPEDWHDGTSLSWVVIDVRSPALMGTIRLRPPQEGTLPEFPEYSQHGAAVRDFDGRFALTFRRMADGVGAAERFPLPHRCG